MTGCYCEVGEGESPDYVFVDREVTARRQHACCECQEPIARGDRYHLFQAKWEDGIATFKTCLYCKGERDRIGRQSPDRQRPAFGNLACYVYNEIIEEAGP